MLCRSPYFKVTSLQWAYFCKQPIKGIQISSSSIRNTFFFTRRRVYIIPLKREDENMPTMINILHKTKRKINLSDTKSL